MNAEYKFRNDLEFSAVKKMQPLDLKKFNYYENYLNLINQLKEGLQADPIEIFTENELVRHLYGWRGDHNGCRDSLIAMHEWRKDTKPDYYTFENDFGHLDFDLREVIQQKGVDVYGRPIILVIGRNLFPKKMSVEIILKYLIYIIETCVRKLPSYLDKFVLFVDLKQIGYSNFSADHITKLDKLTKKYYVERLAKIIIYNKGFIFTILWKIVSKFLDEKVHKKLIIADSSHKKYLQYILGDNYSSFEIDM